MHRTFAPEPFAVVLEWNHRPDLDVLRCFARLPMGVHRTASRQITRRFRRYRQLARCLDCQQRPRDRFERDRSALDPLIALAWNGNLELEGVGSVARKRGSH